MANLEVNAVIIGDIAMDRNLARTRRTKSELSLWSTDDTASTTPW
jgi:hypothetical protein